MNLLCFLLGSVVGFCVAALCFALRKTNDEYRINELEMRLAMLNDMYL